MTTIRFTNKFLTLFLALLVLMVVLFGCASKGSGTPEITASSNQLLIHYIDVGQADCILIQYNRKNMLIDAGNQEDGDHIVSYLKSKNVKKIDCIVATHPHEDHIGGMAEVINSFDIGKIYAPKVTANTQIFEGLITAIQKKNLKIIPAKAGTSIDLDSKLELSLLAPNSTKYEDLNNYSAVVKLTYGNTKFLFMGDAEKLSEEEILDKDFDPSCDVLKVGHHGSSSSSSAKFLDKASPKIAIISCGKGNKYGHPHKETMSALKKRKIQIYRTDEEGTVVLSSDGKNIEKK